jgi:PhnB protein
MAVKPIPEGFHTITPYLIVENVPKLMEFLANAFGAKELFKMDDPRGGVMHAEMRIGDSVVMMGEAMGEHKPLHGGFYLYVEDVDAVYQRAVQAGGTSTREPTNEFYGDRVGGVKDAFGNNWWIATHVEDVSPDELARRAQALKSPV